MIAIFKMVVKHRCVIFLSVLVAILVMAVQIFPLGAYPTAGKYKDVDAAIILGFGYEEADNGTMKPGAANEFLLEWVLENYPQVKSIFVQEGVWVARCQSSKSICQFSEDDRDVEFIRIHQHNPKLYVNTFEAASCAINRMTEFGKKKVILVAHDLQLWRAAMVFYRVKRKICNDCEFIIPNVPDTPYPKNSVQFHTQNEFIYRFAEILARFRDSEFFAPDHKIKRKCIAP